MTKFCKGLRAGDEWVFQTNSGGICRTIVGFDEERVYYRSYGDIHEKSCKAATFNRWLKGAQLQFRRPDAAGAGAVDPTVPVLRRNWSGGLTAGPADGGVNQSDGTQR